MKVSKRQLAVYLALVVILVVSLVMTVLNFTVIPFWVHPMLNFVFYLFVQLGVLALVLGFVNRSPWYFFLSAITLGLSVFYVMMNYLLYAWWLCLIVLIVVVAIISLLSLMVAGNKTENIALNKSPDYQDYKQRREIKKAQEEAEPEVELPKIKSFKDEE